jgi:hypothetical protein
LDRYVLVALVWAAPCQGGKESAENAYALISDYKPVPLPLPLLLKNLLQNAINPVTPAGTNF